MGVDGNVSCVAAVVKDRVLACISVVCLCKGCDGCCVCIVTRGKYECFVMQMLYVCVVCASCGSSQC